MLGFLLLIIGERNLNFFHLLVCIFLKPFQQSAVLVLRDIHFTFVLALAIVMNKLQLLFHHIFRFIWNIIFVVSYPVLATFGLLFVGVTYVFSGISRLLTKLRSSSETPIPTNSSWEPLSDQVNLLEAKLYKQIMFGPSCFQLRRIDGIPSVLEDHYFGNKVRILVEGILLEKWNATESKDLPDFDICLYDPDTDKLTPLTNIKCFDWHLAGREENNLSFKWFDGIQGGEVNVALS